MSVVPSSPRVGASIWKGHEAGCTRGCVCLYVCLLMKSPPRKLSVADAQRWMHGGCVVTDASWRERERGTEWRSVCVATRGCDAHIFVRGCTHERFCADCYCVVAPVSLDTVALGRSQDEWTLISRARALKKVSAMGVARARQSPSRYSVQMDSRSSSGTRQLLGCRSFALVFGTYGALYRTDRREPHVGAREQTPPSRRRPPSRRYKRLMASTKQPILSAQGGRIGTVCGMFRKLDLT